MSTQRRLIDRFLDESYSPETRRHVGTLTIARMTTNGCFRFAPPFLASISNDFNISLSRLGLALMFTEITMAVAPILGSYVDRVHRRTAMAGGLIGLSGATAMAAASPSLWVFMIGILLLGICKFIFDMGLTAWVNDRGLRTTRSGHRSHRNIMGTWFTHRRHIDGPCGLGNIVALGIRRGSAQCGANGSVGRHAS